MADLQITDEVDELAVALVQALARQDADKAITLSELLFPMTQGRPGLQARVAAWAAQAHQLNGDLDSALTHIRDAISLAQAAGETDAISPLRQLKASIVSGRAAIAAAMQAPLPDTPVGRALTEIDKGNNEEGGKLARQARLLAQSEGNYRDEVLALLALARIPGQEDSAIRAAYLVADESDDKNLVTAVSRAANTAKVELPKMKL